MTITRFWIHWPNAGGRVETLIYARVNIDVDSKVTTVTAAGAAAGQRNGECTERK